MTAESAVFEAYGCDDWGLGIEVCFNALSCAFNEQYNLSLHANVPDRR